jgi:hypothetical protein
VDRSPQCENLLYIQPSRACPAPARLAALIVHATAVGKLPRQQKAGETRPRETRRTTGRPLALPRQRTAAAAEAHPGAARRTDWAPHPAHGTSQGRMPCTDPRPTVGLSAPISNRLAIRHRRDDKRPDYDPAFLGWLFWWYLATIELTDRILGRQAEI